MKQQLTASKGHGLTQIIKVFVFCQLLFVFLSSFCYRIVCVTSIFGFQGNLFVIFQLFCRTSALSTDKILSMHLLNYMYCWTNQQNWFVQSIQKQCDRHIWNPLESKHTKQVKFHWSSGRLLDFNCIFGQAHGYQIGQKTSQMKIAAPKNKTVQYFLRALTRFLTVNIQKYVFVFNIETYLTYNRNQCWQTKI